MKTQIKWYIKFDQFMLTYFMYSTSLYVLSTHVDLDDCKFIALNLQQNNYVDLNNHLLLSLA